MGKKKQSVISDSKNKVVNFYGTKSEWVKATLDLRMCDVFENAFMEKIVVAEDDNGLYVTGESFVDAPLLDPYRLYHRVVPDVVTEGDTTVYKINK